MLNWFYKICFFKEQFYGRSVELADREFVEQHADEMLNQAVNGTVALLVVGDPLGYQQIKLIN